MIHASAPPGARVVRPARRLRGELTVPGDKSITHRGLLLGAQAGGRTRLRNPGLGADTRASAALVRALGADVSMDEHELTVTGLGLHGLREPADVLDCGNSGTTMRLAGGLLAGRPLHAVLTGDASLRTRPMDRIVRPLRTLGARIDGRANGAYAPLAIAPGTLHGAELDIPVASAQVKSAVILAALRADGPTVLRQPAPSRDHTERILQAQGAVLHTTGGEIRCEPAHDLQALDLDVPGDISSAAFWIAAAVLHPDAEITIRNVGLNPLRTGILDALQTMGADIETHVETTDPEPSGAVTARTSDLHAIEAGGHLIPRLIDEASLLALLATRAHGESRIADAAELRVKESDRLHTTERALSALGLELDAESDGFTIAGGARAGGGAVEAAGDHRIAMLAAVAAVSGTGPVTIRGAEAVDVSYPTFWDDLASLSQ